MKSRASKIKIAAGALQDAILNIEAAQARVAAAHQAHERALNAARSEVGTAEAELAKHEAAYTAARSRLLALAPPISTEDDA